METIKDECQGIDRLTSADKLEYQLTSENCSRHDYKKNAKVERYTNAQDLTTNRTSGSLVNNLAILSYDPYKPTAKTNPLITPIWNRE